VTSMQPLKIALLRPADIAPNVATMVNITAWLKRKFISAFRQEESSWPNVCLVQTTGSTRYICMYRKKFLINHVERQVLHGRLKRKKIVESRRVVNISHKKNF